MEKDFQNYLIAELTEIKDITSSLSYEFQQYKTQAAEKYVTISHCADCTKDKSNNKSGIFGWIIGVYVFVASTAVTLFTLLLSRK